MPPKERMMTRRLYGLVALGLFAAAAVAISLTQGSGNERQVRYHLRKLEDATYAAVPPANARDALRWRNLRSLVAVKCSPIKDPSLEMEKEREQLVKLGYFQKRSFTLADRNLISGLYPAVMAADLKD